MFLAVIGPRWLDATNEQGARRLNDANDFVRIEIESGLKLAKWIIPVLVNDAAMPRAEHLPEPLHSFVRRNAIRLTHERFNADAEGLVKVLKDVLAEAEHARKAGTETERRAAEAASTSVSKEAGEKSRRPSAWTQPAVDCQGLDARAVTRARVFAFSVLPFQIFLGFVFDAISLNWVGGRAATGYLLALVIALGSAAALSYRRRAILTGTEIGSYWLGCTPASILALTKVFQANAWNWVGAPDPSYGGFATGLLLGTAIALGSAAALSYRRRAMLSGAEIGFYWLGCTLALILALVSLFGVNEWDWVGASDPGAGGLVTGFLLALAIGLGSAAALAYWRRAARNKSAIR